MIQWSHSKIADYLQCPHKFYQKYVAKTTDRGETPAMRKGNHQHSLMELAINASTPDELATRKTKLEIESLSRVIPIIEKLRALGAAAELELGVTRDWKPCGFWDKEAWGRCKIDALAASPDGKGLIIDWKTGATKNIKYQTDAELRLHATIANAHFPELKVISAVYYYTQGFQFHPAPPEKPYVIYEFAAERHRVNELMSRIDYAVDNDLCKMRKNNLCPWCEVKKCPNCKPREPR